jgi:hypothetical protein
MQRKTRPEEASTYSSMITFRVVHLLDSTTHQGCVTELCCKDSTTHQGCVTELCCKNTAEIELSGGVRIPIDLDFVFSDTRKLYFPTLFLPEC